MDAFKEYFYLGIITKIHGNNGEVTAYLDVDSPKQYAGLDMIFLSINNSPVPYFIESVKILNNKAIIAFEGIDSIAKASALIKKEMFLPLSVLPPLTGNKFYYHEVEGFTVIDEKHGELGLIKEILDYPNQAVIQVFHKEKEILIPLNDDIIKKVDRNAKTIDVKAPEGLIEIYLES
jgi:16S rRNA processing protein RimM